MFLKIHLTPSKWNRAPASTATLPVLETAFTPLLSVVLRKVPRPSPTPGGLGSRASFPRGPRGCRLPGAGPELRADSPLCPGPAAPSRGDSLAATRTSTWVMGLSPSRHNLRQSSHQLRARECAHTPHAHTTVHTRTTLRPTTDLHTHHGALTDHAQTSHRLTHTHPTVHTRSPHTQCCIPHILCRVLFLFASPSRRSFLWKVSLDPWTTERSVRSLPHGLLSFCGWLMVWCHYSQTPPPELLEETLREGRLPRHQPPLQGGHRKAGFWPWAQESGVACAQPCTR